MPLLSCLSSLWMHPPRAEQAGISLGAGEEGSLNAKHAEHGKGAQGPKAVLTQTLPICEHLQKSELFLKQAMFSVMQLKQLKIAQE